MTTLETYMMVAIEEAKKAISENEVPVGAIIVYNDEIIARDHDRREALKDPAAHAEILVLRDAGKSLNRWQLDKCDMYVTLEPCVMCAGAILSARIRKVIYGASNPKSGGSFLLKDFYNLPDFNHRASIIEGILKDECGSLLTGFFDRIR